MRDKPGAARSSVEAVRARSLRRRILEYIAQQGGELRSDSGHGLQRQICDALDDRPTRVSQALIALERGGLLEREMDLERHRCQIIRLGPRRNPPRPVPKGHPETNSAGHDPRDPIVADPRQRTELEAAQLELYDLIRQAAAASRRVEKLRRATFRANEDTHGRNQNPPMRKPPR